jgi:hypothetical protein
MQAEAEPKVDWARHALRINEIIDNQVAIERSGPAAESTARRRLELFASYYGDAGGNPLRNATRRPRCPVHGHAGLAARIDDNRATIN